MPVLKNPRHEAFAEALARGMSASAAYAEVGYRPHRHNAATLARKKHISERVSELQEEQLAIHQQATAEAAANAKVTIESLIAEAEAARMPIAVYASRPLSPAATQHSLPSGR
jgi:phage terminase small subunit